MASQITGLSAAAAIARHNADEAGSAIYQGTARPGRAGGSGGTAGGPGAATILNAAPDQQRDAEDQLNQARDDLAGQRAYLTEVLNWISVAVLTCSADGTLREVNGVARAAHNGAIPVYVNDLHGIAEPGANLATALHPLVRALHG